MQTFRSRRGDPLKAAAAAGEQQATNPFYIKATAVRRTTLEAWSRHTSETSHYAKAYLTIQKKGPSFLILHSRKQSFDPYLQSQIIFSSL